MRPLVRWTMGDVSEAGHEILRESVRCFAAIYPEFDRIICHNHLDELYLLGIDAELRNQTLADAPCVLAEPIDNYEESTGCGWKLCPPRLRPDSHELWLDNDLVICKRIEEIDRWLAGNKAIITEGLGRRRMFGLYDEHISPELRLCAGLFGLPPHFDFAAAIRSRIDVMEGKPLGGYDEQGLTASVVTSMDYIIVPLSQVHIAEDHVPFSSHLYAGFHFAGANRKPWHRGWQSYKKTQAGLRLF